jgi:hypothetical protein
MVCSFEQVSNLDKQVIWSCVLFSAHTTHTIDYATLHLKCNVQTHVLCAICMGGNLSSLSSPTREQFPRCPIDENWRTIICVLEVVQLDGKWSTEGGDAKENLF